MSYPSGTTPPKTYDSATQAARHTALQAKKKSGTWTPQNPLLVMDPYGTTASGLYVYFTGGSGQLSFTDATSSVEDFSAVAANHADTGFEGLVVALVPGTRNTLTLRWTPSGSGSSASTASGGAVSVRVTLLAPSNPSGYPTQVARRILDEKSLSSGLFAMVGVSGLSTSTYLMDNQGAMRAELASDTATFNLQMSKGSLVTATGTQQISAIDPLGHADPIINLTGYSMHHDLVVHDDRIVYALASAGDSTRVEDRVLRIDLDSGKVTEAVDLAKVLPQYEKLAVAPGTNLDGSTGKDWIHLNTLQIVDDVMYLSSREISTIIALDHALDTHSTTSIRFLIGPEAMWQGTGYEKHLLTPVGSPIRNAGQHSVHRIDDPKLPTGQYYLEMFNNNYWHVGSRTDIDWKSAGPSSASLRAIDGTSQALRYLVDEKAGTFRQDFARDVPYSSVVSNVWRLGERTVEDQMVVNSGKSNEYSQHSADGAVLASYRYDSTGLGYRVFKESFQGYWYGA